MADNSVPSALMDTLMAEHGVSYGQTETITSKTPNTPLMCMCYVK